MKKASGFSLIELAVALAIAGIAVTVAIPSFTNLVKSNRLTTQVNMFVTAMHYARSEAVNRGISLDVSAPSGDWSDGWQVSNPADGTVLRTFPAPRGNTTIMSNGNVFQFTYAPTGRITPAAGDTLNVCDDRSGELGRTITIIGTGRVSVTEFTCS